jgi:hypothetical protein
MSESTELVIVEPKNALTVFTAPDEIEAILLKVEQEVSSFVPDVSTKKGRDAIGSLGLKIAKTKTYLDSLGKDLVDEYKEIPKKIDANRKTVRDRLDALKAKTLKPREEWEAEQESIRLAKLAEADHEIALLMNEKFDRDAADTKAEAERKQKEHEERIAKEAAEKARLESEATAQRERDAALQREADLKSQAALAEANRIAAEKKAEQDRIDAANKAEADRLAAAQQAEREKQEAIAAEQLKAKQKEDARLAEEKRIADEAAARAANIEHQKAINNQVIAILTKAGISPDCAKECVIAIVKNQNASAVSGTKPPVQINY